MKCKAAFTYSKGFFLNIVDILTTYGTYDVLGSTALSPCQKKTPK